MNLEQLREQGIEVERKAYYPEGKQRDGSPYACCSEALDFLIDVVKELGLDEVKEAAQKHSGSICGNHLLWAALRKLGIPCEE